MINLSKIFGETYKEYCLEHKFIKHISKSKHSVQDIFLAFHKFVRNSTYFSRHTEIVNGKQLNKIHNFLVEYSFYDILYKKILDIYLNVTNYETLKFISFDGQFIRNILCTEYNDRNPFYNNKPGLKVHIIVDELRTPISLLITESTDNDALSVKPLFENIFIDASCLQKHTLSVAADTGYEGFMNNYYIAEKGLDFYVGYNKRNSNKNNLTNKSLKDPPFKLIQKKRNR